MGNVLTSEQPIAVKILDSHFDWNAAATVSNIIFCLLTLITVVISVWVALSTLKQNNKMIENSTRPYVGITAEHVNNSSTENKLVLKNYGSSEAFIRDLEFIDVNLRGFLPLKPEREPFENLIGSSILPGQSFVCILDTHMVNDLPTNIETRITYESAVGKIYDSTFNIPLGAYEDIPSGRVFDPNTPCKTIAFTLQTIADKML